MTAVLPAPTGVRPRPGDEDRIVTVFANLLPDEVVAARRLRALQRRLVAGLAVLLVLLVTAYGLSWWETRGANGDLDDARLQSTVLTARLADYTPLVTAQAQSAAIGVTLSTLMAHDLSWRDLIVRLQKQAAGDVTIIGVNGSVADPNAATGATEPTSGLDLLNQSGDLVVGSLTITGTARDQRSIATFVERLDTVLGVAAPLPSSVTGDKGPRTFSVNALVTSDALGGRFTPAAPSTGGN